MKHCNLLGLALPFGYCASMYLSYAVAVIDFWARHLNNLYVLSTIIFMLLPDEILYPIIIDFPAHPSLAFLTHSK